MKIKTKKEFYKILQENDSSQLTATKPNLKITKDTSTADASNTPVVKIDGKQIIIGTSISKNETTSALNLYLGPGGFVTLDTENDRTVTT